MGPISDKDIKMIMLGSRVRHNVNGFIGIAVKRSNHLYGCTHLHVMPVTLTVDQTPHKFLVSGDEQHWITQEGENICSTLVTPHFDDPIQLGWVIRDKVSGAEGVASIKITSVNGDVHWVIAKQDCNTEGLPKEDFCIHEGQLEIVERREVFDNPESTAGNGSVEFQIDPPDRIVSRVSRYIMDEPIAIAA